MKTQTVFQELFEQTQHVVKHWRNFYDYDKKLIEQHPQTPFIHIALNTGTYLAVLIPADYWTSEKASHLFEGENTNKWDVLNYAHNMQYYNRFPEAVFTYYNGKRLQTISGEYAVRLCKDYEHKTKTEWLRMIDQKAA